MINNNISTNPKEIADHVALFYRELYKSKFEPTYCNEFFNDIKGHIPIISEQFKTNCEKPILKCELVDALKHMNTGKSPGIDGLPVEFYSCFWNIIEAPLMEMYKECINNCQRQ